MNGHFASQCVPWWKCHAYLEIPTVSNWITGEILINIWLAHSTYGHLLGKCGSKCTETELNPLKGSWPIFLKGLVTVSKKKEEKKKKKKKKKNIRNAATQGLEMIIWVLCYKYCCCCCCCCCFFFFFITNDKVYLVIQTR